MKRAALIGFLFFINVGAIYTQNGAPGGQNKEIPAGFYLGFEPRFFIEPEYVPGEFDANIFPLMFETALNNNLGLRFRPNVFFRSGSPGIDFKASSIGAGVSFFYYFNARTSKLQYNGFFLGPCLGFSYLPIDDTNRSTFGIEAGYSFALSPGLTLNVSGQVGGAYFFESGKLNSHLAGLVNIGAWLF